MKIPAGCINQAGDHPLITADDLPKCLPIASTARGDQIGVSGWPGGGE
jgi:hypothetical protein